MALQRPASLTDDFLQGLVARVPSTSGGSWKLTEVYTGELLDDLPQSTPTDIERAYAEARAAQREWAARPLKERLAMLAGGGLPGAKWVPVDNYHLTLRFIGEVPNHRAEEIDAALLAIRAREFSLTMAGIGTFAKGGRAVSLWAGVERNPQLDHLQNKIETALQRVGIEPERRRFAPHVTLARTRRPVDVVRWARLLDTWSSRTWTVDELVLVQSFLGEGPRGRPRYEVCSTHPLGRVSAT